MQKEWKINNMYVSEKLEMKETIHLLLIFKSTYKLSTYFVEV